MSRIDWNDKHLITAVEAIAENVAKEAAGWVAQDAQQILTSKAKHPTGKTGEKLKVKASKFKDGGSIVSVDYPGGHIELGSYKNEAIPFLRPALHKNKAKILRRFKEMLS